MQTVFRKLGMKPLECDHHVRGYFEFNGKRMFATHFSFGRKDIFGRVLKNIMRDLHASDEVFFGLTDCYMDLDDYVQALKAKRLV
jgi:hypothetical protein